MTQCYDSETVYDLWAKVQEHPDFAGGTIFTREDVAHALMGPDAELTELPGPDDIARVTEENMRTARDTIDNLIFAGVGYSWSEALRENLDA